MGGDWKDQRWSGEPPRKPKTGPRSHLPFVAKFPGKCFMCEGAIELGNIIRRAGKRYAHAHCLVTTRAVLREPRPEEHAKPEPLKREPRVVRWVDLMGREHVEVVE